MRKPLLAAVAIVAIAYLVVVMSGRNCHYNVHLVKRIYCTDGE